MVFQGFPDRVAAGQDIFFLFFPDITGNGFFPHGFTVLKIAVCCGCRRALRLFDLELLDTAEPVYRCRCSRRKVEAALISTGRQELLDMAQEPSTEVQCQFCDKVYRFSSEEIRALVERASK